MAKKRLETMARGPGEVARDAIAILSSMKGGERDEVVISLTTTRWAMERLQALAVSGRYPRSFSACADEVLRAALREIEARGGGAKGGA
jgi:hypothetical protein